mmetsp:Transcript_2512/g.5272  ORF Transcript_2512/g.5272 Transcript_2512/m.5272 type:complete len:459 (-) Transcript_2512:476-1852(-)
MQFDALVLDEGVEGSDGVRSSADTGHDAVRELSDLGLHLLLDLDSNDPLKVSDNGRERVRPHGAADEVVRVPDVGYPVPHGLVDGILEGPLTGLDGDDGCAERVHPEHIELLPLRVNLPHINNALQPQHSADRGGGDAVLPRPRLGYDPVLAEALGHKGLADGVVDLVSAGVGQVLPLEPDVSATGELGQARGEVKRGGSADELLPVLGDLGLELRVGLDLLILHVDFPESLRKCLRDELPPKLAEPALVGLGGLGDRGPADNSGLVDSGLLFGARDHVGHKFLARLGPLLRAGVGAHLVDDVEDGGADDDAIPNLSDLVHLVRVSDAKADGQGQLRLLPDPCDEVLEVGRELRPRPRDARHRHAVDEARRRLKEVLDALVRGRRRNKGDIAELVGGALGDKASALLGGKVHDDEAVSTRLGSVFRQLVDAVLEERVVVSHEHHRYCQAPLPRLLHKS